MTPEKQEDFVRSGVDEVIFSIDGATQHSYARYRKGGQLSLALDNMKAIIALRDQLGIPLHVLKWPGLSIQETVFFKVDSFPVFFVFPAALERRA